MVLFDFNFEASQAILYLFRYLNLVQSLFCSEQENVCIDWSYIIDLWTVLYLHVRCLILSLQVNNLNVTFHFYAQKNCVIKNSHHFIYCAPSLKSFKVGDRLINFKNLYVEPSSNCHFRVIYLNKTTNCIVFKLEFLSAHY